MTARLRVGLVGDRDEHVPAHRAIPLALQLASEACGVQVEPVWIPTDQVEGGAVLENCDGLWCIPASPYRSMDGALTAIRFARERQVPYLGTCGGFQHAVIEYARNVLDRRDAEHAETAPDAQRQVIVPLLCSLVEMTENVKLVPDSRLARAYGSAAVSEGYHCSYGLSPEFRAAIVSGPLRITATDDAGDVRGIELNDHPFFVTTLFQHERGALQGRLPPPVRAFTEAMIENR